MAMNAPSHPGLSIKENCLVPLDLSVTGAADILGVAPHTLSRVLNGRAAISPEMAIRFEKAGTRAAAQGCSRSPISPEMAIRFEKAGWSNAEFWLRRQAAYDLAQARQNEDRIVVERRRLPAIATQSA